jgi:hypothetical protein
VSYIVDVIADGPDVDARGRFRADINTGRDGVSEIVFGAIMPPEADRQMLGSTEYLVDATRGTVGMVGFQFWGPEQSLTFNVMSVADSGPYLVTMKWRGVDR